MDSLSFVFQGKIHSKNCVDLRLIANLKEVRKIYPKSEIILSTWKVSEETKVILEKLLDKLNIILVFSNDPGPLVLKDKKVRWVTNINRMIISSLNGIKCSSREYVVKLRTDSFFYNRNLASILSKKNLIEKKFLRSKNSSLFSERMINCNLFARHSRSYKPFLFHPGDIMLLGRRQDLIDLFDLPLADNKIFEVIFRFPIFSLMKYVPEQYIWVMYIKKKIGKEVFLGNDHYNKKLMLLSEEYYINNFVPLNCQQLGFIWTKHKEVYKGKGQDTIYRYKDWESLNLIHGNNIKKINNPKRLFSINEQCKIKIKKLFYFAIYIFLRAPVIRRAAMKLSLRR